MRTDKINKIFCYWLEHNPEPTTELRYRTPFQLLIAVILSAQSTDKMVNKVTRDLFAQAPNAKRMAALEPEQIAELIARLGLYRNKARFVHQCSQELLARHRGRVPKTRAELEQLPGVGRKTANVVLNTLYGQNEIAVDTHIFRVSNRMGMVRAKTPLATERGLKKIVPEKYQQHAHHWLILHGRYICKAMKPQCHLCGVYEWCEYKDKAAKVNALTASTGAGKTVSGGRKH